MRPVLGAAAPGGKDRRGETKGDGRMRRDRCERKERNTSFGPVPRTNWHSVLHQKGELFSGAWWHQLAWAL